MEKQGEQEDGRIAVQIEEQTDRQQVQTEKQTDRPQFKQPRPQWGPSHAEASGTVGGRC